eukprot:1102771-Heterocapsa_arctica.AAC.1
MFTTMLAYFSHNAGGYSAELAEAFLPLIDWCRPVQVQRPESEPRPSTAPVQRAGFQSGGP